MMNAQKRRTRKDQILRVVGVPTQTVAEIRGSDQKFIDALRAEFGLDPISDVIEVWGRDV